MASAAPVCNTKGGYIVQPAAGAPPSINKVLDNNTIPATNIQKLMLFMRGKAISGAPIISGIIQFAKPTKGRHNPAKNHDQGMHGGHGIEELRLDKRQPRLKKLRPNYQGHYPAHEKHCEGKYQVKRTDVLVVSRNYPSKPTFCRAMIVVIMFMGVVFIMFSYNSGHIISSFLVY